MGSKMTGPTVVQDRISKLISEGIHIEVPSVGTDLFDAGLLDSLAFVELLLILEREFGIQISIEELEIDRFRSIERIAEFVSSRTNLNGESPAGQGVRSSLLDDRAR